MTIPRKDSRMLIHPEDVEPSHPDLQVVGVFNPAVAEYNGGVQLMLRVAEAPREAREGYTASPRYDLEGGLHIDWIPAGEADTADPRMIFFHDGRKARLTFVSHCRLATLKDGLTVDWIDPKPTLGPALDYETYGIEDPRATRIGDAWHMTYVGVSPRGIVTCLASGEHLGAMRRRGIILPTPNKDVLLFPEKIDDHYVAMHRPCAGDFNTAEMWLATSPDLIHWGNHRVFVRYEDVPHTQRVGGGVPPLAVEEGWLNLYHGARPLPGGARTLYYGAAMLLDREDPGRILKWAKDPFLEPVEPWETQGFFGNVVFPTGAVRRGDDLYVYYGAGDSATAVAVLAMDDVMGTLREH